MELVQVMYRGTFGVGPDFDSALVDAIRRYRTEQSWAAGELHALAVVR